MPHHTRLKKLANFIMIRSHALTITLLVTALFAVLFESLIKTQSEQLAIQNQLEGLSYGNLLRTNLERELHSQLFLPAGLASYFNVYHNELDPQKIQDILADLYQRSQHVVNLAVIIGYKIAHVYPIEGNESIIGIDYRQLPAQWPLVKRTVDTGAGTLVGPIMMVQGIEGLIYRYPVYVAGSYWGMVSVVIDPQPFFQAAFNEMRSADFAFSIRNKSTTSTPNPAFYGDNALFSQADALLLESKIPNGKWEWAIVRQTANASHHFFLLLRALGLIFSLLLGATLYSLLRERSKLRQHAMYDSLTGLANRRLLYDRVTQALIQAKRFGRYLAILYIDVDYFKEINDTHGHAFGDSFLQTVAKALQTCIRKSDTLSRIGGDEFVIVLGEIHSPEAVSVVAQNIIALFEEPILVDRTWLRVSLSIGVAIYDPASSDTIDDLLHKADLALYAVKARGRDGYMVFDEQAD